MGYSDECEAMMLLLRDKGPRSQAEAIADLSWPYRKVNEILTQLRLAGRIDAMMPVREGGEKITRYCMRGHR